MFSGWNVKGLQNPAKHISVTSGRNENSSAGDLPLTVQILLLTIMIILNLDGLEKCISHNFIQFHP